MMLEEYRGSVVNSNSTFIAHVMNCQEKMTSETATALVKKYPEIELIDWNYERKGREKLGKCSFGLTNDRKKIIFNLYAQMEENGIMDYSYFEEAFEMMLIIADRMGMKGFPIRIGVAYNIGCNKDDGQGEVQKVHAILQKLSKRYERDINIYYDRTSTKYR